MDWVVAADEFEPYGTSHLAVTVLLLVGAVLLVPVGRARRRLGDADVSGKVFAVAMAAFTVPLQALSLVRTDWDVQRSLPLQLCDLAAIVAVYALWTRSRWAVALTYFWGLPLTTQAVATPDLSTGFPDPVFVLFWGMHLLVVWAAVYLTWGLGVVPGWREYGRTVAITLVWAVGVFAFNAWSGANYGYLNEKPGAASILDLLGDWPVYVLAEAVIILAVWALMTWPWVRRSRRPVEAVAAAGRQR